MYETGMWYTLEEIAIPFASGTKEIALAPRLLVFVARRARKRPFSSRAELRLGGQVPAVKVSGKRVMAVAGPFHRAPDPSRRPGNQREFRTGAVADAEIAADIARHDADGGGRHPEHGGDVVALPYHAAAGAGIDGVPRPARV